MAKLDQEMLWHKSLSAMVFHIVSELIMLLALPITLNPMILMSL